MVFCTASIKKILDLRCTRQTAMDAVNKCLVRRKHDGTSGIFRNLCKYADDTDYNKRPQKKGGAV